jgi:hypothetical protein
MLSSMTLRRRLAIAAVGLGTAAVLAFVGRRLALASTAKLFAPLAACLAGPERASPEEATIRARRIHWRRDSIQRCSDHAGRLAGSRAARWVARDLFEAANTAEEEISRGRIPDVARLFEEAAPLRWAPPTGWTKTGAPHPLLDAELDAVRSRAPSYVELRQFVDDEPPDAVRVLGPKGAVAIVEDRGRPLTRPVKLLETVRFAHASRRDDRVLYVDPERAETDVGRGTSAIVIGRWIVWRDDKTVRAREVGTDHAGALPLDGELAFQGYRGCLLQGGALVGIETDRSITVARLGESGMDVWGDIPRPATEPPAHTGSWTMTCDRERARIAWASSDPPKEPAPLAMKGWDRLPDDPGPHLVIHVTCDKAGCERREARVSGIDTPWQSIGGWSSAMYRQTPEVVDLRARTLVMWQGGGGVVYRLAPLDDLERAETRWIAELSRPGSDESVVPRTLAWPELRLFSRGEVALVAVRESRDPSAAYLFRFDAGGEVSLLELPWR